MNNFNDYTNENNTKQNEKWPYIRHHPYQILVIGGSKWICELNRGATSH